MFGSGRPLAEILERLGQLFLALVLQSAADAEITQFLGRDRYVRGTREHQGHRNGRQPLTIKTTGGPVTVWRQKLRGTVERFASVLFGWGVVRSNALEALIIAGFLRGLSVRDVEAAIAEALGPAASVSKSTVSRVCEAIRTEFAAWRRRSLKAVELCYLFADASTFKMHKGARGEPVLGVLGDHA